MEDTLGNPFVRIHRSRLARRAALRRVDMLKSGDFTVTLANGETLRGSRRYRAGLEE
ncbi:MAG: LytTR family transcriptional regulator DNA-binding domain-containing protein [Parerythrobacter sp.]